MKAALAIAIVLLAQPAQAAETIGRIFYTPEQRDQLDMLRRQKAVSVQVKDEPVPEIVTFNGIVRRNDGKATVWLNNQPLSEAELKNKQSIVGTIGRNGQVTLQSPQSAVQMRLKVGQSAELLSGRIDESYSLQSLAQPPSKEQQKSTDKSAPKPEAKPAPESSTSQNMPPELVEALRQAAARAREHNANSPAAAVTPAPAAKR